MTTTSNWRKVDNERGFTFYTNENNKKQWDHPKYSDLKLRLDDCNYIKFASYRVAHKFRALQHSLYMNEVPLSTIRGVFERHKLGVTENTLFLESCDLEAVLSDIFFATNKQYHTNIDVDTATELMLNFIYNIYDADRQTNVEVLPSKLVLALLSNCSINELNNFLFNLCCDHNNCVTRLRLQTILCKISAITNYLNEVVSFGPHLVNASIEQCFNNSPGLVGIDESTFYTWLENSNTPQIFAWLPILHRIKLSETVVHKAKCCVCKMNPIIGMKYKCVKCTKYVQCQRCFLTGRTSHSHKLTHVMREYCKDSTKHLNISCFSSRIFKLLKCKYRVCDSLRDDITQLRNRPLSNVYNDLLLKPTPDLDQENTLIEPLSSPLSQLQVIIRQLEMQNKELQEVLQSTRKNDDNIKKCVEEHRQNVAKQVNKLKSLKEYLSNNCNTVRITASPLRTLQNTKNLEMQVQSTPLVQHYRTLPKTMRGMDLFSPIAQSAQNSQLYQSQSQSNLLTSVYQHERKEDSDYSTAYTMKDISTWLGGQASYQNDAEMEINLVGKDKDCGKTTPEQTDLDDALAKLQQILANNFSLDESLGSIDNCQLKSAVNEVEGVLSSIIDTAECHNQHTTGATTTASSCSCFSSVLSDQFKSYSNYLSAEG